MNPERWLQLKSILIDAFEQDSTDARHEFVVRFCSGDQTLLQDAESLLAEAEILRRSANDDLEACAQHAERRIRRNVASPAGRRIGAYAVKREIGRGGMGIVYLAARADGYFDKEVAIKLLNPGANTEEMTRRFHSERQVVARLEHPNIARLLDAGSTEDGCQYFVMEYVDGLPVTLFLEQTKASIEDRLELFLKVCSAVQAAHAKLVVHRDLKPSNILVTENGEVKLLDFGIAKVMLGADEPSKLSRTSGDLFTPLSASPEQAKGEAVTVSTDVYALGVLLYEILTGSKPHRFPHRNPTLEELVTVLCEQEPYPPSTVVKDPARQRRLRGDLDAIVLCALQKDPAKRYSSVKDFAGDLQRHLTGKPIHVRSTELTYFLWTVVLRNRLLRFALAVCAGALGLSVLFVSGRFLSNRRQADLPDHASHSSLSTIATPANNSIAVLLFRSVTPGSAVLPFDALESNAADSYFTEGVHADIVGGLTQLSQLKVISRDSVAAYRGAQNSRAIGEALGVAYLLEGSVQKTGDRFRITTHLTDTRNDARIWEGHSEKTIDALFSVESEIIQAIATHMNVSLSQEETTALGVAPTPDMQAYDSYLRGLHAFHQRDYASATELLRAALARDPRFVLAHCLLSKAYLDSYRFVYPSEESLAAARNAAEMAVKLAPRLPDAHLAMARYYRAARDFKRALTELTGMGIPRDRAEYNELLALAARRNGQWKDALRDGEAALELAPENPFIAIELLESYIALRQFKEAEALADRVTKRFPPDDDVISLYRSYSRLGLGQLDEARSVLEKAPGRTVWGTNRLIQLAIFARDFAHAEKLIDSLPAEKKYSLPWEGRVAQLRGQPDKARQFFNAAIEHYRSQLEKRPDDLDALSGLGIASAALGLKEDALRAAKRAIELVPLSGNALDAPAQMLVLAEIHAQLGESEAALEQLAKIVELPAGPDYGTLKFDPVWDDLRSSPKFQKILARASEPPNWN